MRCWGSNLLGQLGFDGGSYRYFGAGLALTDGQDIGSVPFVDFQDPDVLVVAQVSAGDEHTCFRYALGTVRCFGRGYEGQLGINAACVGTSTPNACTPIAGLAFVSFSDPTLAVVDVAAGRRSTCVVFAADAGPNVACFGMHVPLAGQDELGCTTCLAGDRSGYLNLGLTPYVRQDTCASGYPFGTGQCLVFSGATGNNVDTQLIGPARILTSFSVTAHVYIDRSEPGVGVDDLKAVFESYDGCAGSGTGFGLYVSLRGLMLTDCNLTPWCSTSSLERAFLNDVSWNHIVLTVDAGTATLYINVNEALSLNDPAHVSDLVLPQGPAGGSLLRIGGYAPFSTVFTGQMLDLQVWDHALNIVEIAQLLTARAPADSVGLLLSHEFWTSFADGVRVSDRNFASASLADLAMPTFPDSFPAVAISANRFDESGTCAVFASGRLRCWGLNAYGNLGYMFNRQIAPRLSDFSVLGYGGPEAGPGLLFATPPEILADTVESVTLMGTSFLPAPIILAQWVRIDNTVAGTTACEYLSDTAVVCPTLALPTEPQVRVQLLFQSASGDAPITSFSPQGVSLTLPIFREPLIQSVEDAITALRNVLTIY